MPNGKLEEKNYLEIDIYNFLFVIIKGNYNIISLLGDMIVMNEASTDLWVWELLKEAGISKSMSPQGSSVKELNEALKTASKSRTGNVGRPEYIGVIQDFVIVIENKKDTTNHIKRTEKEVIATDTASIRDFAVNGALFYATLVSSDIFLYSLNQNVCSV